MIDLRAARNDPDDFRRRLARKGAAEAFDQLLLADERWRSLVPRVDELRARTKLKGKPTPEQLEELRGVKEELQRAEQELAEAEQSRDELALRVPNPPADDVPDGSTEDDVRVERRVGEPPKLTDPKEHLEIGRFVILEVRLADVRQLAFGRRASRQGDHRRGQRQAEELAPEQARQNGLQSAFAIVDEA